MPELTEQAARPSLQPKGRAHERAVLRRYAATQSPAVRDEIVRSMMPLARSLASRYRGGQEPFEDLVEVANIGLVTALERFDPEHGAPFASFAVATILGELRHHFRDRVWQLRLPRAQQELTMRIDRAVDQLNGELGRSPTPSEIAAHLGVDSERVLAAIAASHARLLNVDPMRRSHQADQAVDRTSASLSR